MRDSGSWRGGWLDRRFAIEERGSTPWREMIAGVTTFATMMYIIAVNPAIMAATGMDRGDVASATMIVALLGCVMMALSANLPLGLAPSMGSNAFFAVIMVGKMGMNWRAALAAILCSGVIILLLSLLRIRALLIQAVPEELKSGLQLSFGLFVGSIAVDQSGLMHSAVAAAPVWLAAGGFVLAALLVRLRIPGALILSIVLTALAGLALPIRSGIAVTSLPATILSWPRWPRETFLALDPGGLLATPVHSLVAIAFVTISECIGLLATTVTVMRMTGLSRQDGLMPGATAAFASDATATIVGAFVGTATVSPYVESVAGVQAGGRTGLAALTTAAGFGAALFFWPLLAAMPPQATAPALAIIGLSMIRHAIKEMDLRDVRSVLTAASMFMATLVTVNLIDALAIGSLCYLATRIGQGMVRPVTWVLCVLFLALWGATQILG